MMRHVLRCALVPLCSSFVLSAGCAPFTQRVDETEADEIVGAPPTREEDPFATQVLPPEATPAPTSGTMDVEEGTAMEPARVEPATPSPDEIERATTKPPVVAPAPPAVESIDEPEPDPIVRCFSCVRICPESDSSSDCSGSKEDMICGWGTSLERADATTLARAQCDAALDMAREMKRFRRIDGSCPVSSCVE